MDSTEELCRSKLLDAPGRIRCLKSGCTALGKVARIGGGCILIQTTHKHPALGLGSVVFDAFGPGYQVRTDTKLMFQDDVNVVLSMPAEIEFYPVPAKYALTKEPVLASAIAEGEEARIKVIGVGAGGFVFETEDLVETRVKNQFALQGQMRNHMLTGDFCFERVEAGYMVFGVEIMATDRIQTALWHNALKDLVA
ncbi:MAG: hypothetical protein JSS65_12135 [Armatimonadetes bacterium]|nr:hypothetical protein [Armatimonadota bacterium]